MSRWWNADKYNITIKPVDVISETAKYVTLAAYESFFKRPMRVLKADEYFPTFGEARTYLMNMLARKINYAEQELESLRRKSSKVFMMEPPQYRQDGPFER